MAEELESINQDDTPELSNSSADAAGNLQSEEPAASAAEGRGSRRRGTGRSAAKDSWGSDTNYLVSSFEKRRDHSESEQSEVVEKVVFINRCAKVVKGGRRFSFSALMVVGDKAGRVGVGFGKANEVSEAIRKATEAGHKVMVSVKRYKSTIPHSVLGKFGGSRVLLKPASPGTGVIAGGGARAVLEAVGIRDVLAKSQGSRNPANVVKATLDALSQLRLKEEVYQDRGKRVRAADAAVA